MYKNILVPVLLGDDHEPHDTQASFLATKVLADEGAAVTLLHVMERVPAFAATYIDPETLAKSRADAKSALAAMAEAVPGAKTEMREGHAGREIVDYASKHGVDCIVMASHRPGLSNYLLGSTADRVVRHAQCAVHVIR